MHHQIILIVIFTLEINININNIKKTIHNHVHVNNNIIRLLSISQP